MKRVLQRFGVISLTAASGFYFGAYLERSRNPPTLCPTDSASLFKNLPALPIFGTVSAAVPLFNDELELIKEQNRGEKVSVPTAQVIFQILFVFANTQISYLL